MLSAGAHVADAAPKPNTHWLNGERVRVYSWLLLGVFGTGVLLLVWLSLPDLVDPRGKPVGNDFIEFWSAARLALAGTPTAAYDWQAIGAVQHSLMPSLLPDIVFAWPYPPIFLLPVLPLGLLPYPAALVVFMLITGGLWAWFVSRLLPHRSAWVVAAAAPAGLINLLGGQNGFLTAALAGFALLLLSRRRPLSAGIVIGLLAIKPHLAVLFPVALLAAREWRAFAAAGLTVLALAASSVAAFGIEPWLAFFTQLPVYQKLAVAGEVPWSAMPSPFIFALSLGLPVKVAWVLQATVVLFVALNVWMVWRKPRVRFEVRAAVLLTGSLLASPYLFSYDLTWTAAAIGWLAVVGLQTGFRTGEREVLLFAWIAPLLMQPVQVLTSVQLGCPALLLLLLVALRRAAPPTDFAAVARAS